MIYLTLLLFSCFKILVQSKHYMSLNLGTCLFSFYGFNLPIGWRNTRLESICLEMFRALSMFLNEGVFLSISAIHCIDFRENVPTR